MQSVLGAETWYGCLCDKERNFLLGFLPSGETNVDSLLRDGEIVGWFQKYLRAGELHPDVANIRMHCQFLERKNREMDLEIERLYLAKKS